MVWQSALVELTGYLPMTDEFRSVVVTFLLLLARPSQDFILPLIP